MIVSFEIENYSFPRTEHLEYIKFIHTDWDSWPDFLLLVIRYGVYRNSEYAQ